MIISIHKIKDGNRIELPVLKNFLFPGGEVGIQLDAAHLAYLSTKTAYQTVTCRPQNPVDVLVLINVVDALKRLDKTPIRLFMPYFPYSRQDRVCVPGEAFSLGVFAKLINHMHFERVTIVDPHSDVVPAVIDNVQVISQLDVINRYQDFISFVMTNDTRFVSPDAGANKKTSNLAKYFGHSDFIRADKLRNLETGHIKETLVYADNLNGQTIVIADDICDGGRTFIELAKVLKSKGAAKVVLFVTHGIFSKGVEELLKNGIDDIYTTNSYKTTTGSLKALNLEKAFQI